MTKKRAARPRPEQLVFPFELAVGDVVLEDGARLEVIGRPTSVISGKMTRARVRRDGEAVQHDAMWEVWRKLRVVRWSAAWKSPASGQTEASACRLDGDGIATQVGPLHSRCAGRCRRNLQLIQMWRGAGP